jgi:ribosomal protein L40E
MSNTSPIEPERIFVSKKCPECYGYMPLEADRCPSCKTRVGPIGSHGMAQRRTNWRAYIIALIAWILFAVYIKWAFL